mmetsp:Transcript_12285/g.26270  ORF Transcript_12285/g.26270 Transcript_12285/m.26270 type:complete len:207 (-) Transcript_12285:45-665(-)
MSGVKREHSVISAAPMRAMLGIGCERIVLDSESPATRCSVFSVLRNAPLTVFSAGIARFDSRALKYSKGVSSTRAVVFICTAMLGLRSVVGDALAQCTAPAMASCSGTTFPRLTPGARGLMTNGCCESTITRGTRASSMRSKRKKAARPCSRLRRAASLSTGSSSSTSASSESESTSAFGFLLVGCFFAVGISSVVGLRSLRCRVR